MKAINDHIFAINLSVQELLKGKFWIYILPAVVIGVLFFISSNFLANMFSFVDGSASVPLIGTYLQTGVEYSKSFFTYIGDLFFQFLVLTLLSPIYCLLSEKVDNTVTGAKFDGGIIRILTDLIRAIFIVILSMILYFTFVGFWWFLSWITGFHLLDEIIYFVIASFFLGFSFYDYSLERYSVGTIKSWGFCFEKLLYMILTGGMFYLLFKIPLVGIIIAPFFVTIVSTIVFLKMNQKIPAKNEQTI